MTAALHHPPAPSTDLRWLRVRGARLHNLQNVDVDLPLRALVAVTGVSGSGKSSLVFDTLCAASERRYLETLAPSLRQRFAQADRPDVDVLAHLPPAVAVRCTLEQWPHDRRTTIGTVTGCEAHLGRLFAAGGVIVCPGCGATIHGDSADSAATWLAQWPPGVKFQVAVAADDLETTSLKELQADGLTRVIAGGVTQELAALHSARLPTGAWLVVDRLITGRTSVERLTESLELALRLGNGRCVVLVPADAAVPARPSVSCDVDGRDWKRIDLCREPRCEPCGRTFRAPEPRLFDVCSPHSACPACRGSGVAAPGVCPECHGKRYRPETLAVRWEGRDFAETLGLAIDAAAAAARGWEVAAPDAGRPALQRVRGEVARLLESLTALGLGYLTLDRPVATLSAGELQRVLLGRALSQRLVDTLIAIEEPSIGLHPADWSKLWAALREAQRAGNSILVVEHQPELVAAADYVVEVGPGGGAAGGRIVAAAVPAQVLADPATATHAAWAAARRPLESQSRRPLTEWATLTGVRHHNLRDVAVRIPLGGLCVVTGVSGSGKTSLVMGTLRPALRAQRGADISQEEHGAWDACEFPSHWTGVQAIDQGPLTSSRRTTMVNWLKAFDEIRQVFAETPEAKRRGWTATQFSFHAAQGGRCPACRGVGRRVVELTYLPEVAVTCTTCQGTRFRSEVLEARYRGSSIADVLSMTVAEAAVLFRTWQRLQERFRILERLGLSYLVLGQPASSLSGGEAQRVKLASQLWNTAAGPTIFLCDEPSAGLHPQDLPGLVQCFRELIDIGHSVVIVDQQRALLDAADWIIELGPGAGPHGGQIVASGTPEEHRDQPGSLTGRLLRGEFRVAADSSAAGSTRR